MCPINEVAIAPDDRTIASIGQDGTLRLWPMPEGEPPMQLPLDRFLERLQSLTNLRLVQQEDRPTSYGMNLDPPLPAWERISVR